VKTTPEFMAFVQEQLEPLRGVVLRRMFSGAGLAIDGHNFAMLIDNTLYFTVDDETRPRYEAMGSHCFSYPRGARQVDIRSYYMVPADLLEDRDALLSLAREAMAVGLRKPRPKARAKKAAPKTATKTATKKVARKTARKAAKKDPKP
jgi:DNA transformation protein